MISRNQLKDVTRIVIKLGTGVITNSDKHPDLPRMVHLASQVNELRRMGKEVVIVSSGAVAAGRHVLGFKSKPTELADLQACAAVGQCSLMSIYQKLFSIYQINIAQVLLTHDDLEDHDRYLNVRSTLQSLIQNQIVPIINENDTVSVEELKFGDNDRLSALVASLLPADLLILLTTIDGLMQDFGQPTQKLIPNVEKIDDTIRVLASGTRSDTAVGGMKTKIMAAEISTRSCIPMLIADGRKRDILPQLIQGEEIGTLFQPDDDFLPGRKRWIAFCHYPKGSLIVDQGAHEAIVQRGKSLLFPGVRAVHGDFSEGDVVSIKDERNREFARGMVEISSTKLKLNEPPAEEVIHRNNLVLL